MKVEHVVRRLEVADAEAFVVLRREALANDPFAFAASPEDDRGLLVEEVRVFLANRAEQAVFGGFDGGQLAGIVGLYRENKLKRRHIAHVWGVYVTPSMRGRGLARAMMEALVAHARTCEGLELVELSAATSTPAPIRLYESLGFRAWGVEKNAIKWNDAYADDVQMVLELKG
jgi:RimJ/RimL family protein N-acetyltransferase